MFSTYELVIVVISVIVIAIVVYGIIKISKKIK